MSKIYKKEYLLFYGTDLAFIYSLAHPKLSAYSAIRLRPQKCSCYLYRSTAYSIFLGCGSLDCFFKLCEIVSLFLYGKQRFMSLNFSRREHSTQPGFIWARTFGFPHSHSHSHSLEFERWCVANHPAAVFRLEQLDSIGYCIDIGWSKITFKHNVLLSTANG